MVLPMIIYVWIHIVISFLCLVFIEQSIGKRVIYAIQLTIETGILLLYYLFR